MLSSLVEMIILFSGSPFPMVSIAYEFELKSGALMTM